MQLLNAILIVTKCSDVEQLKSLPPERKKWLAQALDERVPSDMATIEEWNEVLMLFMDTDSESDNKTAKKKLLGFLNGEINEKGSAAAEVISNGN